MKEPIDLHGAEFVNVGYLSNRLNPLWWGNRESRMWMAYFRYVNHVYHDGTIIFPLCLEISYSPPGAITDWLVKTPPGRRGWNATILFDQQGKLVSKVLFNQGAVLRLIFLNKALTQGQWSAWDELNSAIALHVVEPHV